MKAKFLKYWFLIFFIFLMLMSYFAQKRNINWTETYSPNDKIPYGTFLLFDQLPELFPDQIIRRSNEPFSSWMDEEGTQLNLLIISNTEEFGEVDQELLLDFADRGNQVFIANERVAGEFKKKLGIQDLTDFSLNQDTAISLLLVNPEYSRDTARFTRINNFTFLHPDDSFEGQILGIGAQEARPDFVRLPYGKGAIFFHCVPQVFTNIHFLESPEYVARCLSYLPVQETIWDDHYKPFHQKPDTGAFQLIHQNEALTYAWNLLIIGSILALVFFAKRRQRVIPVIPEPENKSLEFIETIGDLYYHEANHLDVAQKKIRYFYHNVYLLFLLHENETDFWTKLEKKSGAKEETIKSLKEMILAIKGLKSVSADFLIRLNRHLENFYSQTGKYSNHE